MATNCDFNGAEFSEGSLICSNGRELRCSGGSWQETGYRCFTESDNPQVYAREADPEKSGDSAKFAPCVRPILGSPDGYVSVYNMCDKCARIVVDWGNGTVEQYNIQGNTRVDLQRLSSSMFIIGEKDC